MTLSFSKILIAVAALCIFTGPAFAQEVEPPNPVRNSDPEVNKPKPNVRRKPSAADKKREEIEQTIQKGNDARASNQYKTAVDAYAHVANILSPKEARAHYGLGNVYADLSCPDSAIASYRTALSYKRDYRDAIIALGYVLANKHRFDEAESQFKELFNSKKDDPAGNIGLGFVSWKRKNYDEAIKQLNLVINGQTVKKLDRSLALLVLGDVYRERANWAQAKTTYQKAIELYQGDDFTRWVASQAYVGLGLSELFPAMSDFSRFTHDERNTQDRERVIKAARQAEDYMVRAIYDFKYGHPNSYLYWALALQYQLRFPDAESKFNEYYKKIDELEGQVPSLAKTKTCDYGFVALRANYYSYMGHFLQQQRFLTSDPQETAKLDNKAIENFQQAVRLRSDDAGAYSTLAGIFLMRKQYAEAAEQYEHALSHARNESQKTNYYRGRGFVFSRMGRFSEAVADLKRAISIEPDEVTQYWLLSSVYDDQGMWDEAISAGRSAMEREKPPVAHSYQFLANTHYKAARQTRNAAHFEEALKLARKAIEISPTFASGYLLLGRIYKSYNNGIGADEILRNFQLAAQYDPRNPQIFLSLGDQYLLLKNENAAIKSYSEAIALKPDWAEAYWALGLAYHQKGDDAEAARQLENAIKHDPKHLIAYLDLANVYDKQKRHEEAILLSLKATEEFPTDYLPYKELARIYTNSKKIHEAIRYYEKSIELVKGNEAWVGEVMKCRVLRLRSQYSESISCAQNLKLPASGDPAQIPYEIGLTHVASGNKEAAQKQYEELRKLQSSRAEDLLRQINEMKR